MNAVVCGHSDESRKPVFEECVPDSGFRRNDKEFGMSVIPVKTGIQR